MSAPQLQWDLSRSVGDTLAIGQGIIRAATTDDVQILALLACERFGATLAICQETCRKVEFEVIKVQNSSQRVLSFLGATIGYSREDCASQLVRSLAGVQFIGLAAALVSSLSLFQGATVLAAMLQDSASDKTLLPPVRHIRGLLASLEHRCHRLGFADQVAGWQRLFDSRSVGDQVTQNIFHNYPSFYSIDVPGCLFLQKLVDAFRQLSRMGDASSITLRTIAGMKALIVINYSFST